MADGYVHYKCVFALHVHASECILSMLFIVCNMQVDRVPDAYWMRFDACSIELVTGLYRIMTIIATTEISICIGSSKEY